MLDIDRSGDFFVDDQMLEIPVPAAFRKISSETAISWIFWMKSW